MKLWFLLFDNKNIIEGSFKNEIIDLSTKVIRNQSLPHWFCSEYQPLFPWYIGSSHWLNICINNGKVSNLILFPILNPLLDQWSILWFRVWIFCNQRVWPAMNFWLGWPRSVFWPGWSLWSKAEIFKAAAENRFWNESAVLFYLFEILKFFKINLLCFLIPAFSGKIHFIL